MSCRTRRKVALLCALALSPFVVGCGAPSSEPAPGAEALTTPTSPEQAGERLAQVLAGSDPIRRVVATGELLSGLDPAALPAVLEAFVASPLDGLDAEFVLLANWWGGFDPKAALLWATRDPRATSYAVIAGVHRSWAHHDPQAAWESARRQPQLSVAPASAAVVAGWDESGQPGLVAQIQKLPAGVARQSANTLLARRKVLALGAAEAIDWVQALTPGEYQRELELRIVGEAAWFDPVGVARWAEPHVRSAERTTGLPGRIATRWVRLENPEDAMAWLATLPDGDDRQEGVTEGFRDWLANDTENAVAWLEKQELEPWSEPAFALYAQFISADRPEEAMERLLQLSDPGLRDSFAVRLLRWWRQRDPAAAEAWMAEDQSFPEELKERARNSPQPRRKRRGLAPS